MNCLEEIQALKLFFRTCAFYKRGFTVEVWIDGINPTLWGESPWGESAWGSEAGTPGGYSRKYDFDLSSKELTPDVLASFDCVLLATNHDDFDYDMIAKDAKLIVDTRGVYSDVHPNIIKA